MVRVWLTVAALAALVPAQAKDGRYQGDNWSVRLGPDWTVVDRSNAAVARTGIASIKTGGRTSDARFVDSMLERASDRIGKGLARLFVYMPDPEATPLTLNVWTHAGGVRASELKNKSNVELLRTELGKQLCPPGTSIKGEITSQSWRKVDGFDAIHLSAEQSMPGLAMKLEYFFIPLPTALLCVEASYSAADAKLATAGMDAWLGSFDGAGQPSWFSSGGIMGGAMRGALIGLVVGVVLTILKKLKS